ncbi:Syntaxin-52-like protein [Melia azedarach]|uniref:Syntaxin-52-like protein n=1 Tax=Melia azedarach TaxID=155640 RepID=A0ACC1YAN1_MELAZ|nr:Syntaxin-52-like protein [Melia azedarach]
MAKQYLVIDAWIREAQEAAKLVEEIDARVQNKNLEKSQEQQLLQQRLGDEIARSKLLEVGIKIDRLESLLHNPPSKPILTNEDLESRWKMVSDIKLRTRALAISLYAMPLTNNQGDLPATDAKATSSKANSNDHGQMKASFANNESEQLKPLVSEDAIRSNTRMQINLHSFHISMSLLRKVCWTICIILGAAACLFVLAILCAVI